MMEWLRRRRLEKMVDWGMTYGLYYQERNGEDWAIWPDSCDERTIENCHEAAKKTIDALVAKPGWRVGSVYRYMNRVRKGIALQTELMLKIDAEAVSQLRSEIMVDLYRSGREEHPLYAVLAEASSMKQLKSIKREVADMPKHAVGSEL